MSSQQSHIEIERKYDVDEETSLPHLVGSGAVAVASTPEIHQLDAVYFDTADCALAASLIAVRQRHGGPDEGWHVKLPQSGEGRREVQWPLGDDDEPPRPVQEFLAAQLGVDQLERLVPLARITNTRKVIVLHDAAGFDLAEVCDDHVRSENLRTGGTDSWREWEVELLGGAPDSRRGRAALLDAIQERLMVAGARQASSVSKLHRALGV